MPRLTLALTGATCFAGLLACTQLSMPEPGEGAFFFAQNCASCHGSGGQGDGAMSAELATKPRDLTTLSRDNGGTFPTARALSYIYGASDDNHLLRVMPEFGGAMADDLVPLVVDGVETPTPRVLAALLAYMDAIQR